MRVFAKPESKFQIIREMTSRDGNVLKVSSLCQIAGVSRSGYYNWLAQEPARKERELQDQADFALILGAYNHRGYDKGARSIYMNLIHQSPPVVMNLKKIRRLMHKYGLTCPIRKANPYRRMAKALQENSVAPNLLQRQFRTYGPRMTLLTDISYMVYDFGRKKCFLSTILDSFTKQVLSYVLSPSLAIDFVLETVNILIENHGISLQAETIINSDQGAHYTSRKFSQLLQDHELRQSMSRRANCWDNAPQESFFGHMKDEISIYECKRFSQVKAIVDDWIEYYNNERYQWDLARLSPNEYYQYVVTGKYPLNAGMPSSLDDENHDKSFD